MSINEKSNKADSKFYENLVFSKTKDYDTIIKALNVVRKFLLREKRILVGGMAIDYALKLKDHKGIYSDEALPDYDIISDTHYQDAYSVAEWLSRLGFKGISVINALHPTTMKVRINFVVILDITYVPKNIIDHIPTLWYKGLKIVHPHYQYIDQHRALSYIYENAPFETVMVRPKKDMPRHDLLYQYYPLRKLNIENFSVELRNEEKISISFLESQCISGFAALNYWVDKATKLGFKNYHNLGSFKIIKEDVYYTIPMDSHGITLFTDNIHEMYENIVKKYEIKDTRFYNKFLGIFPRKIIMNNKFELMENFHKLAAHKIENTNIYISNIQPIMMYLLGNYILLMKIKDIKRGYSFYTAYLVCRDLVKWASERYYSHNSDNKGNNNEVYKDFLPTAESYGKYNFSESYIVSKYKFDVRNKTIEDEKKYNQPHNIYDRDLVYKSIPKKYFKFNISESDLFLIDGKETNNFIMRQSN